MISGFFVLIDWILIRNEDHSNFVSLDFEVPHREWASDWRVDHLQKIRSPGSSGFNQAWSEITVKLPYWILELNLAQFKRLALSLVITNKELSPHRVWIFPALDKHWKVAISSWVYLAAFLQLLKVNLHENEGQKRPAAGKRIARRRHWEKD